MDKLENIKRTLTRSSAGLALGFGALGLSKWVGDAISSGNVHKLTDNLSKTISFNEFNINNLTKTGFDYFGDMLNNLGKSINSVINENKNLFQLINESYLLLEVKNKLNIPISLEKKNIPQAPRSLCLKIKRLLEKNEEEAIKIYKNEVEKKGLRCGCVQNYYINKLNKL